jgi:hypothetical protein
MRIVHFAYGGSSSQDCLNVGYVSQLLQDMIQKIYGPNNYLSKKIYIYGPNNCGAIAL